MEAGWETIHPGLGCLTSGDKISDIKIPCHSATFLLYGSPRMPDPRPGRLLTPDSVPLLREATC